MIYFNVCMIFKYVEYMKRNNEKFKKLKRKAKKTRKIEFKVEDFVEILCFESEKEARDTYTNLKICIEHDQITQFHPETKEKRPRRYDNKAEKMKKLKKS